MKSEGNSWDGLDNAAELRRLREMFAQSPSFSALLQGFEHRIVQVNPAYQRLIGRRNVVGLTVREAIPELEKQGFLALLDQVFSSGEPHIGRDAELIIQRTPDGPPETRYLDFVYQPIKDGAGNVTSIFVEGSDITDRHRRRKRCGPPRPVCAH